MPANMISAVVTSRPRVRGRSSAIVMAGPMPGRTPIAVPSSTPRNANMRFVDGGVRTWDLGGETARPASPPQLSPNCPDEPTPTGSELSAMPLATTDLSDERPDAQVCEPLFQSYGGRTAFSGTVATLKVF